MMEDYTEKDIENLFRDWYRDDNCVLIGQQVRVPTGVIDLLFYNIRWGNPIVVEVKKGKAPKNILAQLYGYVWYIQDRINDFGGKKPFHDNLPANSIAGKVVGIILAEDIDDKTKLAINYSHDIRYLKYQVKGSRVRFFRSWEHDDYLRPTRGADPAIERMIELSNRVVREEKLDDDRRLANNKGGTYDPFMICDLMAKDNTIWKRGR